MLKKLLLYCLLLLIARDIVAQDTTAATNRLPADSVLKLHVRTIHISGNKKTKDYIIRREIQFKEGDSILIAALVKELELARQQVYNTTLFNEVKLQVIPINAFDIDITVEVKERWYIFPVPQFQIVDRSFNEWLVKYKGDLSRVNYGLKFVHYNLSGRRDPLRLYLTNGYTRNITLSYASPYSNSALTEGFSFVGSYSQNREIAYKTSYDNKLQFFNNGAFARNSFVLGAGYIIRRAIRGRHLLNLVYTHYNVNDSIITSAYNPNYFKDPVASKGYLDLTYSYQYIDVNNVAYPLRGVTGFLTASKRGFGFTGGTNSFYIEGGYNRYFDLKKNWYYTLNLLGRVRFPFDQAYINQRAMGFGESYIRGLEYYVIDGVAHGIVKSSLKKKLISFNIPFPIKSLAKNIPFTIFAKTFADFGYAYIPAKYNSNLSNRFLYSGGFGIDILTFYDLNLRFEYSFNQLGEKGLFLHSQGGF